MDRLNIRLVEHPLVYQFDQSSLHHLWQHLDALIRILLSFRPVYNPSVNCVQIPQFNEKAVKIRPMTVGFFQRLSGIQKGIGRDVDRDLTKISMVWCNCFEC